MGGWLKMGGPEGNRAQRSWLVACAMNVGHHRVLDQTDDGMTALSRDDLFRNPEELRDLGFHVESLWKVKMATGSPCRPKSEERGLISSPS